MVLRTRHDSILDQLGLSGEVVSLLLLNVLSLGYFCSIYLENLEKTKQKKNKAVKNRSDSIFFLDIRV